jgi:hypothetical protein
MLLENVLLKTGLKQNLILLTLFIFNLRQNYSHFFPEKVSFFFEKLISTFCQLEEISKAFSKYDSKLIV